MTPIIFKYFWVAFILVTVLNAFSFKRRGAFYIEKDPSLEKGYRSLFLGYLFWLNIPWVIMGVGILSGQVSTVTEYMNPRMGNPYVLFWYFSVFCLWALCLFWLFFRKGAETLARHPGAIVMQVGFKTQEITSPKWIKVIFVICILGGVGGFILMWFMSVP